MTLSEHSSEKRHSTPNRIPWPPIILIAAIICGLVLGRFMPSLLNLQMVGYLPFGEAQVWLGRMIIGAAIAMDLWVLAIFKKHKTNIRPDRPAETLVTSGPFAFSRNPIYVGNVAIIFGFAVMKGSLWYLLLVPMVFILIERLAIRREEAHIAARFGPAWDEYAARVRRWL